MCLSGHADVFLQRLQNYFVVYTENILHGYSFWERALNQGWSIFLDKFSALKASVTLIFDFMWEQPSPASKLIRLSFFTHKIWVNSLIAVSQFLTVRGAGVVSPGRYCIALYDLDKSEAGLMVGTLTLWPLGHTPIFLINESDKLKRITLMELLY